MNVISNKKKTILQSIKRSIDQIEWTTPVVKERALDVCIAIYNNYLNKGGDFWKFRQIPSSYIRKIVKDTHKEKEIKEKLYQFVLQTNHSYSNYENTKKTKSFRFRNEILESCNTYNYILSSSGIEIWNEIPIVEWMDHLSFEPGVDEWISKYKVGITDLLIDTEIPDQWVKIESEFDSDDWRYKLEDGIKFCNDQGMNLIKWKHKFYCDTPEQFTRRKTNDLRKIWNGYLFDVENKIWRASRNETNNRLDYNLTNMKGSIIDKLLWKNQQLVELDVSNCQFSILSHITDQLDPLFIKLSQEGKLYNHISKQLKIFEKEAKEIMFRVCFDKVKKEFDFIREIFPMTMEFIDTYKKTHGYKSFSNLLQKKESEIMIDGLTNHLWRKGFIVFPIHDAFRIPEENVKSCEKEIKKYFNEIGFECNIRIKK